ncbi:2-amino-4-hydroxy-6-hydroxymethyldihydropteridine diphosphokinase [Ornithinimicrobium sp. F0845]|uniref:2-amino-4-hydroxy-6- hydroxymethyldihydropteridine diphosphokinase n=1 Tax=Ornithinimicrobium sp. F0845 TaxID=2926412 RepID=UPI001FF6696C|nr:2-amino-4-hydroxy-6-hydroxymethyldihydropteridine diphosphokinase [Ornithinimicrobium sp. F0845]MCK0113718.1 2-amino-4-hydroxy-6-hydroxymethyldihydropteridine diphosphokinase [Ornithinimicrobium sp. F0845]
MGDLHRPDRITLTGVTAYGHHGVLASEKQEGQEFSVDLVLEVDLSRAGASDDLRHTVNYAEVAADAVALLEGPSQDLIETVATQIADAVLTRPLVEAVEVTLHKPHAPVGVPFADVTVALRRERDVPVVIALGANLGADPADTLERAVERLRAVPGLRDVRVSPTVETDPVGGPEQPVYSNAVALARTSLAPWRLLGALHGIEAEFGRTREVRWGARTLDLDLIQVGTPGDSSEVVSDDPDLTLPHPRAHERGFVLAPWHALEETATLRVGDGVVPVADLLPAVSDQGVRGRG